MEPEIIPPDRTARQSNGHRPPWHQSTWRPYGTTGAGGTQRIYVAKLGMLGIIMLMLAFAAIAAVFLILILGAVLLWVPLAALLIVIAIYRHFRR